MFEQLDRLERGARGQANHPPPMYNDSSAGYSAFDAPEIAYEEGNGFSRDYYQHAADEFEEQPMVLDSFGKSSMPMTPTRVLT